MTIKTDSAATVSTPAPHRLGSPDDGVAVVFEWQGDRYGHRIETRGVVCLSSQEGTAQTDWPASPAIQQLSTEMIAGQPTILGVGCCGTTHFSVSVQLESEQETGPAIRFDWAARLSKPLSLEQIGSSPGAEDELAWLGSSYGLLAREVAGKQCTLVPVADAALTDTAEGFQCVQPHRIAELRTVQWSYRLA